MTTKAKTGITVVAVAIVFYIAGALIGWPNSGNGLLGDVGKAKKYTKSVVDVNLDALQEKMQSDSVYRDEMLATAGTMQIHANQFVALIEASTIGFGQNDQMTSSRAAIEQVRQTALNAQMAISQFADDMALLADGKKVKNFEQDFSNAILAFNLLSQNSRVADRFIADADATLSTLEADNKALLALRNEWATFALSNALLNGNGIRCDEVLQMGVILDQEQMGLLQLRNKEALANGPFNLPPANQAVLANDPTNAPGRRNQEQLDLIAHNLGLAPLCGQEALYAIIVIANEEQLSFTNMLYADSRLAENAQLKSRLGLGDILNSSLLLKSLPVIADQEQLGVSFRNEEQLSFLIRNEEQLSFLIRNQEQLGLRIRNDEQLGLRDQEGLCCKTTLIKASEMLSMKMTDMEQLGIRVPANQEQLNSSARRHNQEQLNTAPVPFWNAEQLNCVFPIWNTEQLGLVVVR